MEEYFNSVDLPSRWFMPPGFEEFLIENKQDTAKGCLFLATLKMGSESFGRYIDKAFELGGSDYGYAHFIAAFHYKYSNDDSNNNFIIHHGLKVLDSDLPVDRKQELYPIISVAYYRSDNIFESIRYYIKTLKCKEKVIFTPYFDELPAHKWLEIYKEDPEAFRTLSKLNLINQFCEMLVNYEDCKKENEILRAFPGGPDYLQALEDFNTMK